MKSFKEYLLDRQKVKKQSPDPAEADSLMRQASARLADLLALPLMENNASFRFEAAYESVREAIQSFMALEGFKPYSHEAIVAYAAEKKICNEREAITLDRYREKRNDINYRGQNIILEEAKQIILFAKELVAKLKKKFEQQRKR
ncbi:MAG TPA: hypothetical protein VJC21_03625 [Candidatus Nanoarchaeia archaeon]|nr:hypothetical protein [Candidatus Nanoarchaeia archaeon]